MKKGFSLIEIIVYLGIFTMVAASLFQFILMMISGSSKAKVIEEVAYNLRFAMDKIGSEIRTASGLNTGSSTFDSHPGVLSLSKTSGAENPTVIDVSNSTLRIKYGVSSPINITSQNVEVSNLVFKNLSVGNKVTTIRVSLTIKHKNPDNLDDYQWEETLVSSFKLRR